MYVIYFWQHMSNIIFIVNFIIYNSNIILLVMVQRYIYPRREHGTLAHCRFDVGQSSATFTQHYNNIVAVCHVQCADPEGVGSGVLITPPPFFLNKIASTSIKIAKISIFEPVLKLIMQQLEAQL